jgi:hypothetical protein
VLNIVALGEDVEDVYEDVEDVYGGGDDVEVRVGYAAAGGSEVGGWAVVEDEGRRKGVAHDGLHLGPEGYQAFLQWIGEIGDREVVTPGKDEKVTGDQRAQFRNYDEVAPRL